MLRFHSVLWKYSQNPLKAVILIVPEYYSQRIQIKASQGKKHTGQSPVEAANRRFLCAVPLELGTLLPWHSCVMAPTEYCQLGKLIASSPEVLQGS